MNIFSIRGNKILYILKNTKQQMLNINLSYRKKAEKEDIFIALKEFIFFYVLQFLVSY